MGQKPHTPEEIASKLRQVDVLFGGDRGGPAWCEDSAGRRRTVRARRPYGAGHVVVVSRYHADAGALASLLSGCRVARLDQVGPALKICRVAEGVADRYPRLGRTMEWDTAGPQAVLEVAGSVRAGFGVDWVSCLKAAHVTPVAAAPIGA